MQTQYVCFCKYKYRLHNRQQTPISIYAFANQATINQPYKPTEIPQPPINMSITMQYQQLFIDYKAKKHSNHINIDTNTYL